MTNGGRHPATKLTPNLGDFAKTQISDAHVSTSILLVHFKEDVIVGKIFSVRQL